MGTNFEEDARMMMVVLMATALLADAGDNAVSTYGMLPRPSYRPNDPSRPTVCLVHGMNSSAEGWLHVVPLIEQAGFGVVFYDYPYDQALTKTGALFARDWQVFRDAQGETRPWIVLTHSMGGLVARDYVEGDIYKAGDVSDLILLAPPNQGSAIAELQNLRWVIDAVREAGRGGNRNGGWLDAMRSSDSEAARDLAPGSPYLKSLNARSRRQGVRYHILAGNEGFLDQEGRRQIERRFQVVQRAGGLLGGLTRLGLASLTPALDELTDGTGDGCVSVASSRLAGAPEPVTIRSNHVAIIRGPLLYPDPGPVDSWPVVAPWLEAARRR
jgi:pimeloyl-ACP methyl ester carboxylesterase